MEIVNDINQYISNFPLEIKILLTQLREIIKITALEAEEVISYQMPAFKYHGMW